MIPDIILGPPGTGKTTTLLGMVNEELARGTPPEEIGYVSFTRRAAQEAVERACDQFGLERRRFTYFRTLHSLCFRALSLNNADVLEGTKLQEFADLVGERISGSGAVGEDGVLLSGADRGDRMLFMENLSRIRGVSLREQYDDDHDELEWFSVERFARALAEFKSSRGLLDYTDMLGRFAESEYTPRLQALFVDEAQDLSALQWRVVRKLADRARRLVVAGDDDQAIYRWAGADVEHFITLEGRARVLGQSHRIPGSVHRLADEVIGRVRHRRPKTWAPRLDDGRVMRVSNLGVVDLGAHESTLVLARNTQILRSLERQIRSSGRLYEFRGRPSVPTELRTAIVAWERLRRGDPVPVAEARRIYEYMEMGRGWRRGSKQLPTFGDDDTVTMGDLQQRGGLLCDPQTIWHDALTKIAPGELAYILSALRSGEKLTHAPRIRLSTIHGMKGGEADHVVLVPDMVYRTYDEYHRAPEDEARVWYVGVTRARQQLTILRPQTTRHYRL